jgi:glucose/arabinose dehydrogenase
VVSGPNRCGVALACIAVAFSSACGSASTGSPPAPLVSIGQGLRSRPGLAATVYARGVDTVGALAFDPQDRLWIATDAYTNNGQDGLYVVDKAGATPFEVVSDLSTPLGLLWDSGSLYVASTGSVDAYSDFNGTRFLSRRTVLTLPANAGESNELVLAPDGKMLLGITAPCDHCTPSLAASASIISFLPDGSDLTEYATHIRAPVGLEFYPGTDDLFVTMNQRDDLGTRTPGDWLAVVGQGQSWGFPACYGQGGSACTGVPAPLAVLDKHAAVSGVAIVTGQLSSSVGTAALVAEWSDGVIKEVALTKHGSTYSGTVSTFMTGLEKPVPVILGPDDALYVGDWGSGIVYRVAPA